MENQEQQNQVSITMNDLQIMALIISAGSSRGMFKPNELQPVGELYNKLWYVLEQNNSIPDSLKPQDTTQENNKKEQK